MKKSYEVMDFEPWLASLESGRSERECDLLRRAFNLANQAHENQKRASGEPYIQHCLAVAQMLAELRLDTDTLAAALMHDTLEDTDVTYEQFTGSNVSDGPGRGPLLFPYSEENMAAVYGHHDFFGVSSRPMSKPEDREPLLARVREDANQ